jgi:hypothetical protein
MGGRGNCPSGISATSILEPLGVAVMIVSRYPRATNCCPFGEKGGPFAQLGRLCLALTISH